ncbi:MAG TPA: hypothetical protein VF210_10960 [Pseudomonadales bacterium]
MEEPRVRDDGLQVEEHPGFQRAFWVTQRVAWVVFGVVLLLALAGLTGGGGYLAQGTVVVGGAEVRYPRVARWEAADELRVAFPAGAEVHRLTLGGAFLDHYAVEAAMPRPHRALGTEAGLALEFAGQAGEPLHAVLQLRPLRPGMPRFAVTADGASAEVNAVILP